MSAPKERPLVKGSRKRVGESSGGVGGGGRRTKRARTRADTQAAGRGSASG